MQNKIINSNPPNIKKYENQKNPKKNIKKS